jgi:16S rRNA (uracil1498-N3)-methyltransferase
MSNPVFLCEDLTGDRILLGGTEGRHAATVRRIRVGETVDLVDGRGTRCTCSVTAVGKDSLTCDVDLRTSEPAASPRVTLVQALVKGSRGELAVELATEVGVDAIVPWAASRSIAKVEAGKPLDRWESTAREAAKQSRRAWFPEVATPQSTVAVSALPGTLLVLHEEAATALSTVALPEGDLVLVVGPEGGISPQELDTFTAGGAVAVRLGGSVLRTSTAGAAAIAVVSSRTGRW